ncbi:MAG: TetR/AcrR family transcriptional regulator [Bryobacterales bacterium]|nr:TetR/AcrR family transcriptional regulator [Bryobacterales bacterium]
MKPDRPYHHGNLKDALLEAAVALIAEVGPQAFTLREVARRAGVSHNAPYRHFQDRDELLAAVAAQGFGRLTASMRRASSAGETALERWRLCGRGYIAFALEWPEHFTVMFEAAFDVSQYPECGAAGRAAFETLVERIREAQAEGGMPEGDPMPRALVSWAGVHGLAKLAISRRLPMEPEQVLGFFDGFGAEAMLRGMAAR